MDRPRLRPLDAYPVTHRGQPFLALRDPSFLTDAVATLPPAAVAVVQLLEGELTRDQICEEYRRRHRQPLTRPALDALLAQLDGALLLDSERFRAYSAARFAEFAAAPVRAPLFAGRSYPEDPAQLRASLDRYFGKPHGPGRPRSHSEERPKAIIAPHVDFPRGGAAYAWAYHPLLASSKRPPELVVVMGTDHNGVDQPFTLTRKHYDTPLGRIDTDTALVERLEKEAGGAALFRDDHHHRGEHSIEFQMVWLRHVYGERADSIRALPVLCGSLHEHIEAGGEAAAARATHRFLDTLAKAVSDRDVLWIAAADLAHVGPRYGDAEPLDEHDRTSLEKRDRATLMHALRGDGRGWFEEIHREHDRRRVCGLAPIYGVLNAARPGEGHLAVYAQVAADPGSIVSIASVVYF